MKTGLIVVSVLILLVIGGVWYYQATHPAPTLVPSTPTTTPAVNIPATDTGAAPTSTSSLNAAALPGEHCGGNMATAKSCTTGYHCAPEPGNHLPFGDVGGICVQD